VDGDAFCNICWTDSLGAAPCIQLSCGHIFHVGCMRQRIDAGWPGAAISFSFLNCPLCGVEADHPALEAKTRRMRQLREAVHKEAAAAVVREGMTKDRELCDPAGPFKSDRAKYGVHKFQFLMCSKCKLPYFAGRRACGPAGEADGAAAGGDDDEKAKATTLCSACTPPVTGTAPCPKHGTRSMARKCRYCCSQAVWFCFGTTSFCEKCHSAHCRGESVMRKKPDEYPKCPGPKQCPLKVAHPPNGTEEFGLGCGECSALAKVQLAIKF
jgi:E3 ubiquitin-protein ligase MYCBP2